jgi:presenilin-like A22 family membrane protease
MYFDIVMPAALFAVVIVATLLNGKVEGKLKSTVEEREFQTRDAVLLVAMISVAVSIIVFIPQLAIMAIFLFSYSTLLFMFSYVFSNMQRRKAQLFSGAFGAAALAAAIIPVVKLLTINWTVYGEIAFFSLAAFALAIVLYEQKRAEVKERSYLAVLPPALFILLYVFYNKTPIWFPYLLDTYGIIFALLIILYLGTLFTWKNALIFAGLLTVMDIILVLFTGTMVSAAKHVSNLNLPVLVSLPTLPLITNSKGTVLMSLGLGDFFFAGILAIQTFKRFGMKTAILSMIAMCVSFAIYEAFLLNSGITALPGTLMIISGWLPVIAYATLTKRKPATEQSVITNV